MFFFFLYLFYLISISSCNRAKNYDFILKILSLQLRCNPLHFAWYRKSFWLSSLHLPSPPSLKDCVQWSSSSKIYTLYIENCSMFFFTSMIFKCMFFNRLMVDCIQDPIAAHGWSSCKSNIFMTVSRNIYRSHNIWAFHFLGFDVSIHSSL